MDNFIITVPEAVAKFPELLARVKAGDSFVITDEGREVATLSSQPLEPNLNKVKQVMAEIADIRKGTLLNPPGAEKITLRQLIEEGRM